MYDATLATAMIGRWNAGEGTTRHSSPSGNVTSPRETQNCRASAVAAAGRVLRAASDNEPLSVAEQR